LALPVLVLGGCAIPFSYIAVNEPPADYSPEKHGKPTCSGPHASYVLDTLGAAQMAILAGVAMWAFEPEAKVLAIVPALGALSHILSFRAGVVGDRQCDRARSAWWRSSAGRLECRLRANHYEAEQDPSKKADLLRDLPDACRSTMSEDQPR